MPFHLTINDGPGPARSIPLNEREAVLIGRGDACGVRLTDPSASRVHCRILLADGKVLLEDAGSRWGTLVNGAPVETRELKPGDRIVIGDTELRLEVDAPAATTIAPERRRLLEEVSPHPLIPSSPHQIDARVDVMRRAGDEEMRRTPKRPHTLNLNSLVGEQFLRFRVGAVVARSRSGMVFRALDPRRERNAGRVSNLSDAVSVRPIEEGRVENPSYGERTIALKVFWPDFFSDERAMRRFLRAVRTMLPLEHEHLVKLYTAGRWQGLCFSACEFVDGESVTQIIRRIGVAGMLDWRRAWKIGLGVAQALEYAHERNILHRNVGPSNILVRATDQAVKLGDLMLAKALDESSGGERVTRPGEIVGNLHYLAPEQVSGETHLDGRADIYSLGATLYAILTGRPPFEGGAAAEVIGNILSKKPDPPTKHHLAIPPAFEGVVLRMLAKRPDDRFATAGSLVKDLQRVGRYQGLS